MQAHTQLAKIYIFKKYVDCRTLCFIVVLFYKFQLWVSILICVGINYIWWKSSRLQLVIGRIFKSGTPYTFVEWNASNHTDRAQFLVPVGVGHSDMCVCVRQLAMKPPVKERSSVLFQACEASRGHHGSSGTQASGWGSLHSVPLWLTTLTHQLLTMRLDFLSWI